MASPRDLIVVALANSVVLVAAYLAIAALVWAFADATMPQLRDFGEFPAPSEPGRSWRIAHLSDIHVVGERYGFRIESGRAGPRGNERLHRLFALLDSIHANDPLDIILITGDMTDAGRSAEWSEFLDALTRLSAARRAGFDLARGITTLISSTAPIRPASIFRPVRTESCDGFAFCRPPMLSMETASG